MEGVQRPEDRPHIIVRVFNMKLNEILEDICKHGIFGTVLAYIYVIEFQKRGLPHAHILLTLDSGSKIRTKDGIDKFVSVELPDPCTDLRLFQIVTKCMAHGPCGTININSPCMRDGQCCKRFPKQFKDDTEENVNGYPIYRRRATEPVQQQPIVYQDGQEAQAIERAALRKTTLTSWFELNKNDPSAHNISYSDIPQYYVFDKSTTNWKKRKRGGQNVIGGLPVVSILDTERCITFQQACQEYGLLRGDQQWHDALNEAAQFQSPRQLRMLFAMICGFGEVEDVPDLWVQHQVSLCEDFVHRYSEQTGPHYALADIEELLTSYNLSLQ
ncbi:hypothetical protein AVEN_155439-1, partial [Araneus ventricosus]